MRRAPGAATMVLLALAAAVAACRERRESDATGLLERLEARTDTLEETMATLRPPPPPDSVRGRARP